MPGKKIVYGAVEPSASNHVLAPSNVVIYAALFCCNVFWGGGALFSKLGIHGASPLIFELCREALSFPIMLLGARAMGGTLLPDKEDRLEVLLVSSILIGAQLCFFVGLKHSNPSHCAAWQSMLPVLTTAFNLSSKGTGDVGEVGRRVVGLLRCSLDVFLPQSQFLFGW
jgi:uncharacterized membrane protein